jgi:hypothetical protein
MKVIPEIECKKENKSPLNQGPLEDMLHGYRKISRALN